MIESIIAESDVEIACLQKVRALLVTDGQNAAVLRKPCLYLPSSRPPPRRGFSVRKRKSE